MFDINTDPTRPVWECTKCHTDVDANDGRAKHECPNLSKNPHFSNCMDCRAGTPHRLDNGPSWSFDEIFDVLGFRVT